MNRREINSLTADQVLRLTADEALRLVRSAGVPGSPGPESGEESLPALSLAEYRDEVHTLPPPQLHQAERFADYVSSCHSWYRKLPHYGRGANFVFLINPCAMMEDLPPRVHDRRRFRPYTKQRQMFHYSTMFTETYRTQFGYLGYFVGTGHPAIPVRTRVRSNGCIEARMRRLPQEVMAVSSVRLTGVIDPLMARKWIWRLIDGSLVEWPIESGGAARLREILAYCADDDKNDEEDPGLGELLRSERDRQLGQVVAAIERLKKLLWE